MSNRSGWKVCVHKRPDGLYEPLGLPWLRKEGLSRRKAIEASREFLAKHGGGTIEVYDRADCHGDSDEAIRVFA